MYKISNFNYTLWDETKMQKELIIYNSLEGKLYKTGNLDLANEINYILNNNHIDNTDSKVARFLIANHFIVSEDQNELLIAKIKKLDKQYDRLLHLIIMPTEQCNFRCEYCYEDFKMGKMSQQTQDSIILFIRKNICKYTAVSLDWFGGEPLLEKNIIDYISSNVKNICRTAKKPLISSITTNGYLLDIQTYKNLCNNNLIDLQITIDGIKATHDKQRALQNGGATFDTIINNLIEIKKQIKRNMTKIYIRINVTWDVYEKIDEVIDYLYSLFGDDDRFVFYFRPVTNLGGGAIERIKEKIMNYSEFSTLYRKLHENKKLNKGLYDRAFSAGGSICQASLRNLFIIRSDGRINKCSDYLDWPENQIGILTKNGDMEIDEEKHARWLCAPTNKECYDCSYYGSCFNIGCPAKKIRETSRTCGYEKMFQKETLLLLNAYGRIPEILEEI